MKIILLHHIPGKLGYDTNRGTAPHKHCEVFTNFPSKSLGQFTTFLANPATYLTNFEDLKIEAIFDITFYQSKIVKLTSIQQ